MARILTFPASVSPAPETPPASLPDDYQRISAPPAAFGAATAAALGDVGREVSGVGDLYGQVAAEEQTNHVIEGMNKILYGDPDNPASVGFYNLSGKDALDAYPTVVKQIRDLREAARANLGTVKSQLMFDRVTNQIYNRELRYAGFHNGQAMKQWGAKTAGATADLSLRDLAQATLAGDDDAADNAIHSFMDSRMKVAELTLGHNLPDDIYNDVLAKARAEAVAHQIKTLAPTNPTRAAALMEQNRELLAAQPGYDALANTLRSHEAIASGHAAAAEAMGLSGAGVSRETGPNGPIPTAPTPPAQYAPLIKNSAAQYGVPEDLLTRVLHAENGFRPTGVSSAGARGIAQFMPATAARYGINPDIPEQAIPAAARYLSDLKAEKGTWAGALRGYLGGDPHKDASYTRSGATQLADSLDRGGTFGAGSGQLEIWGDSLGVGLQGHLGAPGHVHGGDTPQTIFDNIKVQPQDHWQGLTVVLPSGSNGAQMPVVEDTIKYLKDHGANVIAVGYGPKFPDKNAELAEIAKRQGVPVIAAEGVGTTEGVHPSPSGYAAMAAKIKPLVTQANAPQQPPAGGDYVEPPAQGETPPAHPPPTAGIPVTPTAGTAASTVPPPSPPPGMSTLAAAETELAQWHARSIVNLDNMAGQLSPQAYEHGAAEIERRFRARQGVITAQRAGIVASQNAALDEYVPQLYPGHPVDPGLPAKIAADNRLGPEGRENLYRLYDAQIKGQADGDVAKYGPKFFDVLLDPSVKDPTQVIAMARPKPDGLQDLTVMGADKIIAELKTRNDPTKYADSKIRDGALAYARKAITIELDTGLGGKIRSPAGEDKFNIGFLPAFFDYWEKGVASGKTPAELVAKDKLDTLMAPFLPSKAEQMKFTLDATKDATTAPVDLKTEAGIVAAYRGGKISRADAEKALIDAGVYQPPPPPPAAPTVSVPVR